MEYKYEALDAKGKEIIDFIHAYDTKAAIKAIRDKGLFPTLVRAVGTDSKPSKKKSKGLPDWLIFRTKKEKAMFSIICVLIILIAGLAKEIMMAG